MLSQEKVSMQTFWTLVCIALNALNELSVKLKKKNNVQQKTPSKDEERENALF